MVRSLAPIVLALSLAGSAARADVVGSPPAMCPRGTVPDLGSHLGSACIAAAPASCPPGTKPRATRAGPLCVVDKPCAGEGTCGQAGACREIALCVVTVKVPVHFGVDEVTNAVGVCGPDRTCPEASRCDVALRCELPPPPPPPAPRRACACARPGAVGTDSRPGLAFAAALGLALAWRRRR